MNIHWSKLFNISLWQWSLTDITLHWNAILNGRISSFIEVSHILKWCAKSIFIAAILQFCLFILHTVLTNSGMQYKRDTERMEQSGKSLVIGQAKTFGQLFLFQRRFCFILSYVSDSPKITTTVFYTLECLQKVARHNHWRTTANV